MSDEHYLAKELYERVRTDSDLFEFLQNGSLDGIWYWDLENPEHEWMSPRFWELFGYDPADKEHLASEWQDMIHPEDLATSLDNFEKHKADPSHPYDQYVRYRHRDGSTVWVRCRGLAIRDETGKPIRMLGTHIDVTALKRAQSEVRIARREQLQQEEHLEQLEESLARYRKLSSDGAATRVTRELSGGAPIRRRAPRQFDEIRREYLALFDRYLEQLVATEAPKPSAPMRTLARRIGDLGGGPRDLLDVHLEALKQAVQGANDARARAYAVEGRLLALEMMGLLVDYYRVGLRPTIAGGESK